MKYFAMIGGVQRGPFDLDRLVEEGVRPDTYVWCKGMDDWTQANEVPDICRFFRQRLAGMHGSQARVSSSDQQIRMPDSMIKDKRESAPKKPWHKTWEEMTPEEREQEELIRKFPPIAQNLIRKSGIKLDKDSIPKENEEGHSKALPIVLFIVFLLIMIFGFFLRYLL